MDEGITFDDGTSLWGDFGWGDEAVTEHPLSEMGADPFEQSRVGPYTGAGNWWESALKTGFPRILDSVVQQQELRRIAAARQAGLVGVGGYSLFPGVNLAAPVVPGSNINLFTILIIVGLYLAFKG